jgi:hypothetical protein
MNFAIVGEAGEKLKRFSGEYKFGMKAAVMTTGLTRPQLTMVGE